MSNTPNLYCSSRRHAQPCRNRAATRNSQNRSINHLIDQSKLRDSSQGIHIIGKLMYGIPSSPGQAVFKRVFIVAKWPSKAPDIWPTMNMFEISKCLNSEGISLLFGMGPLVFDCILIPMHPDGKQGVYFLFSI